MRHIADGSRPNAKRLIRTATPEHPAASFLRVTVRGEPG